MRHLALALFFCFPTVLFAEFESEEKTLLEWFGKSHEENGQESIRIQTQAKGLVSQHRFDDVKWSRDTKEGVRCWVRDPIIGGMAAVGVGAVTLGIWPVGVLVAAGVASVAEKVAQKTDLRKQDDEFMTFSSERNRDRYLAARLLLLIAGYRSDHGPYRMQNIPAIRALYREFAALVYLPLHDEDQEGVQELNLQEDTLALRINKEIHKYNTASLYCFPAGQQPS